MKSKNIFLLMLMVLIGGLAFITTAQPALAVHIGTNLCDTSNATVESIGYSSTAGNAIDHNLTTAWQMNKTDPCYLEISFDATDVITRWVVKNAGANGLDPNLNTRDYQLQYSPDWSGSSWYVADTVTGNTANITDRIFPPVKARRVRLVVTTPTQDGRIYVNIQEVEIYNHSNRVMLPNWIQRYCGYSTHTFDSVGYEVDKACDGDMTTYWKHALDYFYYNGQSCQPWLQVPLHNGPQRITKWVVKHAGAGGLSKNYNTLDFMFVAYFNHKVVYSDTVTGNTADITERYIPIPVMADYVNLVLVNPNQPGGDNFARIFEFEVYSDTASSENLVIRPDSSDCKLTGSWQKVAYSSPVLGDYYYRTTGSGAHSIEFNADVPKGGIYNVSLKFPDYNSQSIQYVLNYGINETRSSSTTAWGVQDLGYYYIDHQNGRLRLDIPAGVEMSIDSAKFLWENDALYGSVNPTSTNGSHYAQYANDGDTEENYWMSSGSLPQGLEITFTSPRRINYLELYFFNNYIPKDYNIKYWDENIGNWVLVRSAVNNAVALSLESMSDIVTTKVKVEFTKGPDIEPNNVRVAEIKVLAR